MKVAFLWLLLIAMCWPLIGECRTTHWTEADWEPLVDEPSRQDLLQLTTPFNFSISSVALNFRFPQDAVDGTTGPRVFGIDISHYSPSTIPFSSFATKKIKYVYVKATQGVSFKDNKFAQFWKALGALPADKQVSRGAYHFLSSSTSADPVLQADRFVAYVNLHGGFKKNDLPPVVDVEWDMANGVDHWRHRTPKEIVATMLAFMNRVEALTGRAPMLYTARSWWRERHIPDADINKFSRFPLWLADYSTSTRLRETPLDPAGGKPDLWQFTDHAKITGGPSSLLDGNVFEGSSADFSRLFQSGR